MNKINNINFGKIILSKRLEQAIKANHENSKELIYLKEAKPDCYVDIHSTETGENYLQATEKYGPFKKGITEELCLDEKQPCILDILSLYNKFEKSVQKRNMKNFN